MSDDTANYLTAKEAARILRVTERQVHHYYTAKRIRAVRAGRRLLYSPDDVQRLASELRVDIRPQHISKQDAGAELVRYIEQRQAYDEQMLQNQRTLAESQQQINERLERMEARLNEPTPQPRGTNWSLVATLAIVLAIALVVLLVALRFF